MRRKIRLTTATRTESNAEADATGETSPSGAYIKRAQAWALLR